MGKCTKRYPYAFMWGTQCCRYEFEDTSAYGLSECDGRPLTLHSLCCKNNEYEKCSDPRGCENRIGLFY